MIIPAAYRERAMLTCDRPGCPAFIVCPLTHKASEREQTRALRVQADAVGWDIARHGSELELDFCEIHHDLANKPKVTELFPTSGTTRSKG